MQEFFYLKVYLFKPNLIAPIKISQDSQLQITVELMDYTIPAGATAAAFSKGCYTDKVYTHDCQVSGNKITFVPPPGFFVYGKNLLQYEISNGVIPLAIDVDCRVSLPASGETAEPETVKPLVQRAEEAAVNAAGSAGAAAGSAAAANQSAQAALEALEKTTAIVANTPYIGDNGNWFVWSAEQDGYVDAGIKAQGPKGDPGAVQTVCGVEPDSAGNVPLTAGNVGARPDSWMPTAADVGAATPAQVNAAVRKAAPHNLLDNSDFRNPVNQRGQTTYNTVGYNIDRWAMFVDIGVINIVSNGLELDATGNAITFTQFLCDDIWNKMVQSGKKYTLAVEYTVVESGANNITLFERKKDNEVVNNRVVDNSVGTHTFISQFTPDSTTGDMKYSPFHLFCRIGNKIILHTAALYEGEYTADTLPEYQPKGYAAELAECQRYYRKYNKCVASVQGADYVWLALNYPPMRAVPSVTTGKLIGGDSVYIDGAVVDGYSVDTTGLSVLHVTGANDKYVYAVENVELIANL